MACCRKKNASAFWGSESGQTVVHCLCSGDQNESFSCCGKEMKCLTPNTSEGAQEKHLPVAKQNGDTVTVKVGDIYHPMEQEHSIEWIYLETTKGGQYCKLAPGEEPAAIFRLADGDKPVAAYAFCNLHGFWKTQM